MGLKITKKPSAAQAEVSTTLKESGKVIAETAGVEAVKVAAIADVKTAGTPWCEVGVEAGFTKNLGNYQSAHLRVSLVVPCQHKDIDLVFDYAKEWVDARLTKLVSELETE